MSLITKIWFRNIANNKTVFAIKILSLSVALVSSFLILLYCFGELNFDSFHRNKDNIYRVVCKIFENGKEISHSAIIPAPVGTLIFDKIPEIENFSRVSIPIRDDIFKYKYEFIHEYGCWVDTSFLHIFTISITKGDNGILKPNSLLISEKLAKKYFRNDDPIGKTVYNYGSGCNGTPYVITGVFKLPENTHFNLNTIQLSENLNNRNDNWDYYEHTYILLRPNTSFKSVEKKITQIVNASGGEIFKKRNLQFEFSLQKLEDIHLHSNLKYEAKVNGDINLVQAMLFLAIAILIIAWVNYTNLSIAQSMDMAKETGIKIIHGASRTEICIRTISESVIINFGAMLIATIIIILTLPYLNCFAERDLLLGLSLPFALLCTGIFFAGSLLSGLYPAIVLTSLSNRDILQGKFKYSQTGVIARKIFLGIQFSAAILIIIVTLFVNKQITFMETYNKGFNPNQVICLDDIYLLKENMNREGFKAELLEYPSIQKVTKAKTLPGNEVYLKELIKRSDSDHSFNNIFEIMVADEDYIDVFQFKIIAGRKFSSDYPSDKQGVILNEEAVKYLEFKNPLAAIDKEIEYRGNNYKVIGVIKNFNQLSLKYSIQPFAYFLRSQGFYAIRVKTSDVKESLSVIDKITRKYFDGSFKYYFVDDLYNQQYKKEIQFKQLFTFFSSLLLFLTCFGLFGLSLYLVNQRRKTTAIHAINGGKPWEIMVLVMKEYIIITTISFLIVCPIAFYFLTNWLQSYAYKTTLNWWVFAVAGAITMTITLLTVSWQSWRVATRNPVESLRYE
jgi:putative ABC transport system permease protein